MPSHGSILSRMRDSRPRTARLLEELAVTAHGHGCVGPRHRRRRKPLSLDQDGGGSVGWARREQAKSFVNGLEGNEKMSAARGMMGEYRKRCHRGSRMDELYEGSRRPPRSRA